jgi:hypothetical protein
MPPVFCRGALTGGGGRPCSTTFGSLQLGQPLDNALKAGYIQVRETARTSFSRKFTSDSRSSVLWSRGGR